MSGVELSVSGGIVRRAVHGLAGLLLFTGCGGGFFPPLTPPGTGTGGGGGGSTGGNFVYVANATTTTVAGFAVATSTAGVASLTAVSGSPVGVSASPSAMVITPANTFLYVAVTGGIYAYAINSTTGALAVANSGGAVSINALGVTSMDISPDGQWLLALAGDGATISEYQINSTNGTLSAATGANYGLSDGSTIVPRMIRVSPNGLYVFAALGTGGDLVFPFTTATGAISTAPLHLSTGDTRTGDNAVAVDSGSTFLYVARSGAINGVGVYAIGAGGALTSVAGSPFAAGNGTFALQIDSTGKYIYAANRSDSTISGYSIGTGGVLTALSGSPYVSGSLVASLARDNGAKYLLAASSGGTPDLTMYSFDTTTAGKLVSATTAVSGTDPAGSFLVVATH